MKTYAHIPVALILTLALLLVAGCSGDNPVDVEDDEEALIFPEPETLTAVPVNAVIQNEVVDEDCQPPAMVDPATPLYHVPHTLAVQGACAPKHTLTTPEGQQITAQEWTKAAGEVTVTCTAGGTQYAFRFQGLVPNGVYTIWHFPETGGGALASQEGLIRNGFTAGPTGAADFTVVGAEGAMTLFGTVAACTLPLPSSREVSDVLGTLFAVIYHKDNKNWGAGPGPEETWIGHRAFQGR